MIRKRRWEDSKHVAIDVSQGLYKSIIFWTDKHFKVIMWDQQFVVFISPWSTRASYHYKLLVPHSHLGHISSPMESPVFGHHISLDNRKDSLPEGEGKDLGNSDKLYLQCW